MNKRLSCELIIAKLRRCSVINYIGKKGSEWGIVIYKKFLTTLFIYF